MLRQFKGVKWLNKVPYFILYDYSNNNIEFINVLVKRKRLIETIGNCLMDV